MDFSEFMSFSRHAVKLCLKAASAVATVNAAALNELMDIAIRIHRHMSRLGTLGPDEIRFKARMYLHLQFATVARVVYTSASAMAVFKEATEVFLTRLPASVRSGSAVTPSKSPARSPASAAAPGTPRACVPASPRKNAWSKPKWGCYLCGGMDHYASDRSKHPCERGAKHAKVPEAIKKQLLARIDASKFAEKVKDEEKKKLREFWSRRCAP